MAACLREAPTDRENPVGVTLHVTADWGSAPDWPALDAAVRSVQEARATLNLLVEIPGDPDSDGAREYLAQLSEHAGDAAALGLSLSREQFAGDLLADPDRLTLAMKRLASAIRGSRADTPVHLGELTSEDLPLMHPLYDRDLRAYVDGYSSGSADATGAPPKEVLSFLREHHPGAPLWLHLPKVSTPLGAQLVVLVAAYRDATFVDLETDHPADLWKALLDLRAQIPPSMAPGFAPLDASITGAGGPREDVGVIHLLDGQTLRQAVVLVPARAGGAAERLRLSVPTVDVTEPETFRLPEGPRRPAPYRVDGESRRTVIDLEWEGRPLFVTFARLKTGSVGRDDVSVSEVYRIPVEVILARHQAVQQAQDIALQNYRCEARVDYHFRLPASAGSVDVTFLNSFFFERGTGARWVQEQLLLNGVAWKGKRIPELPIIEPEKVNVLPLALTLGREYAYRYLRDEEVDGVPCHLVEFLPTPGSTGSRYSGKVWIERDTFKKRRMSVRQTGLQEPQVSNEETDEFRDVTGPDGRSYRLLSSVRGQILFSLAGRNILAERSIAFGDPTVNGEAFRDEVREAEASDKLILQDTDRGLRYLEKGSDGARRIEMEPSSRRTLAVAGLYSDPSLRYPLPLLGLAYVDYAWKGPKNQLSLFATGVVNTLNVSRVNLWKRVDGRLDALLFLIPLEDKFFVGGEEAEAQRVKILRETVSAGLGWRPWEFVKLSVGTDWTYYRYSRTSETAPGFVLPSDHVDGALTLSAEFARRGWSLDADLAAHRRSSWEPWGTLASSRTEGPGSYLTWNAVLAKSFHLQAFQKVAVSASWMDGRDLDRFSKYAFTYMGRHKMAGFAGSGVRFGRGGFLHLLYEFNLAEVVRFSLQVDAGRVRPDRASPSWEDHLGVGFSGSFVGPWRTYWTLDVGRAVRSDIPPLRGEMTAALLVMKFW